RIRSATKPCSTPLVSRVPRIAMVGMTTEFTRQSVLLTSLSCGRTGFRDPRRVFWLAELLLFESAESCLCRGTHSCRHPDKPVTVRAQPAHMSKPRILIIEDDDFQYEIYADA